MACPNCDHTMHRFHVDTFWCPRCGSAKVRHESFEITSPPKLVKRLREYVKLVPPELLLDLHRLGILESIYMREEDHEQTG